MFVPVVVISLLRSPRRALIADHLGGLGIPFRFFDAIEGAKLSEAEKAALNVRRSAVYYFGEMPAGQIGAAASHRALLREIAEGPDAFVCTLQDDARLAPEAVPLLAVETLSRLPAFDVIRLCGVPNRYVRWAAPQARVGDYAVTAPLRGHHGATGQVFSRRGAAKVAAHMQPLRAPDDDLFYRQFAFGLRLLDVRPPAVVGAALPSEIDHARGRATAAINRRNPVLAAAKTVWHVWRRGRQLPSYVAAWGPAMALRLRRHR